MLCKSDKPSIIINKCNNNNAHPLVYYVQTYAWSSLYVISSMVNQLAAHSYSTFPHQHSHGFHDIHTAGPATGTGAACTWGRRKGGGQGRSAVKG